MKPVIASLVLWAVACGRYEAVQLQRVAIDKPPPLIAEGTSSNLVVPSSCPVYAPGGGDVDTPEPPFPAGVFIVCAVDETGRTYGIVNGDAPTARLAVLPGDREIGLYVGFELGPSFTPVLTGSNPTVVAYAAPSDIYSQDCCAEDHPDKRVQPQAVAVGSQGMLVSLGQFDGSPIQVAFFLDPFSWVGRFYVNGPP
jgi:hypothetical protein